MHRRRGQSRRTRPEYIYYIEVDGNPVPADWDAWAEGMNGDDFLCLLTQVGTETVSTQFLGYALSDDSAPLLYVTIRNDHFPYDNMEIQRYATRQEAIAGHDEMVKRIGREQRSRRNS